MKYQNTNKDFYKHSQAYSKTYKKGTGAKKSLALQL